MGGGINFIKKFGNFKKLERQDKVVVAEEIGCRNDVVLNKNKSTLKHWLRQSTKVWKKSSPGYLDGWVSGWVVLKLVLRIAYNYQLIMQLCLYIYILYEGVFQTIIFIQEGVIQTTVAIVGLLSNWFASFILLSKEMRNTFNLVSYFIVNDVMQVGWSKLCEPM